MVDIRVYCKGGKWVCRGWGEEVREGDCIQFVDVGVEYPVYETDAGRFVRILVWELDVDFPEAAGKGGWVWSKRLVRP